MRVLKTPEEIKKGYGYDDGTFNEFSVDEMIIAAQRDALECAAENAESECINLPNGNSMHRVVKSSILNLITIKYES